MKFLIFNGSLKPDAESNTFSVCKMLQLAFDKLGHQCEIVTLRDLDYEGSTDDVNDELKPHIMKMFNMDGVIFATPIWWGTHSCHIQAMLERLDFIYSWAKDNKYQPFYNKVFGTLVSGGGDGFQHIHGVLYSAAANFGFTIPPQCNIESKAQGIEEITKDELRSKRFNDTLAYFGVEDTNLAEEIGTEYIQNSPNRTLLVDGTIEILTYLKEKYQLHIITNGFKEVQHLKLNNCGLTPFFEEVITSEEVGAMKPNAKVFDFSLAKANAKKVESVYIGDDFIVDVEGAKNAGLHTIFYNPNKKQHDLKLFGDIVELKELKYIL